jgi:Baseplate J-like protein
MPTPTSNLPVIQSYEQYLSDMLSSYASSIGINDFNVASINSSFFEAVALATARASGDLLQILNLYNIDRATGDVLRRLALEFGVNPAEAQAASGLVNIIDTSFTKISTAVYSGTAAPNIGSTIINVSDASLFPASGGVYIGRGTPDIEGPLPYATPPVQTGSYWTITLSTATTKYHNLGESVILAQGGNRSIPANVIVISPGVGVSPAIQYGTVNQSVILDGETEVDNVQVTALIPGAAGNVPANSVTQFASAPFSGATVVNPLPFTTGADNATDLELRTQIKNALASQGLGTATAIEAALLGASATESSGIVDSIVSDSLVNNTNGTATVYIDNGNGYEATSNGVALESIVDSALGGEQFFQLQTGGNQAPVVKAFLQTVLAEPYDLIGGDTLAITVGGVTTQHVFNNSDFAAPGAATAYEVTASINADTSLNFEATTADNGTFVVIDGIADFDNDVIFVTLPTTSGRNAAVLLGLPSSTIETLRLYKNGIPLNEDGDTASVFTQAQQLWSNTIANGDTLLLSVDGTSFITYTILNSDFIATGLYTSVNNDNSLVSWAEVFNNKFTGITATVVGDQIELTSNLEASNRANVTIGPSSTLVTKGMFSVTPGLSSQGAASDFTLDRNTAQFELVAPLVEGDVLSAGSAKTAAFVKSSAFSSSSVTLASPGHIWVLVDTAGQIIPTGVIANTVLAVSTPSTNIIRYTSGVSSAFANVLPGDYIIVWSAELPSGDMIEGRVRAVTLTTLDVLITPTEWAAVTTTVGVTFQDGFVILRSALAPQRFEIPAGTMTLDQVAQSLQAQTEELAFSVYLEEALVVTTNSLDPSGSVLMVTSDTQGQILQLTSGLNGVSQPSLLAFYDSQEIAGDFPLFVHSTFITPESANPPDSFIYDLGTAVTLDPTEPNNLICMLHPYGGIDDAQDYGECPQISSLSGTAVAIASNPPPPGVPAPDPYMHRVRAATVSPAEPADRFYVGSPLQFGYGDTMVAIVDGNAISQSYAIPFFRRALTNNTDVVNSNNFNAYDEDAGATASFTTYFSDFNFSNFKVYMQAKHVLKPTPSMTAILYRAAQWGSSGEQVTVAYVYPTGPSQPIGSVITVGTTVAIDINLASGVSSPNSITSSTQWNVTVTSGVPSATIDQVTFTWNGVGTNPALSLSGGEYVNISSASGFSSATVGVWRVSTQAGFTPTATSFSIQAPHGAIAPQTNVPTLVNGAILLYTPSSTTAAQVAAYVNANLTSYVSATLVNDGGTSGSGVIVLSTYEDSAFTEPDVQLQDGANWLLSSNVNSSPQFVLKIALNYPGDGPGNSWYAFNDGEQLRFVPTTMEQVYRFISVLAVTGFTTVGGVGLVDRGTTLELSTDTLGSSGSIQIVGGSANSISLPILDTATNINNNLTAVSVDTIASQPVTSDQWFRLQAAQTQIKVAGFGDNTDVSVIGNDPTTGQSTIVITNSNLTQRNFGKPRNNVRTRGDTFRVEKQGSLTCISWTGVGTDPMFESALNFNDSGGGTANVSPIVSTNDAQITIASGNANFTELSIGDLITISGGSFAPDNQGTFVVTGVSSNGKVIQITNPIAISQTGAAFSTGNFSSTSGVSEGDTVILGAPFASLNQGQYRVIREYNNSIWIQNPDMVEEEVSLPYNPVSLGFDSTTGFNVNASNNTLMLQWNGAGTQPTLGNATVGDIITLGTDFASGNQGNFMVLDSSIALPQITQLALPSGGVFILSGAGTYFSIYSAGNAQSYYVWFNVNGANTDPAPFGYTSGVEVAILNGDNSTSVAAKTALALTGIVGSPFIVANSNNIVMVTTAGDITTNPTANNNVPLPFQITTLQSGTRTFLVAVDPGATTQSSVTVVSGTLQDHRPQMRFFEYEASVPGDLFVATGSTLTLTNAGSYPIVQVLNSTTAIVKGSMSSVSNINLNNLTNTVYIQEGVPYSGYKHIFMISAQPGTTTRNLVVFDTIAQYNKIDVSASVEMTSVGKLNFSTVLRNGLDAYRYNTGLIAVANQIVYGDPRDPITYPGVGAAGADIFIKAPLVLRVKIAVDIRLLTGAPFSIIAQQVQSNVTSLINSNRVGQSIDLSSIVSVIRSIPGITSVAISSPLYSPTDDLIQVTPKEKTLVLNPATDISVSLIGS